MSGDEDFLALVYSFLFLGGRQAVSSLGHRPSPHDDRLLQRSRFASTIKIRKMLKTRVGRGFFVLRRRGKFGEGASDDQCFSTSDGEKVGGIKKKALCELSFFDNISIVIGLFLSEN